MCNKRMVILDSNMIDENGIEIFQGGIPYAVEDGHITNEDGIIVSLNDIWVDFHLEHNFENTHKQGYPLMSKKEMKKIKIAEVITHHLSSSSNMDGEWSANFNIDFILNTPQIIQVFNQTITIDRVKMYSYYDELILRLSSSDKVFESLEVSKIFVKLIIDYLEERKGDKTFLKGWDFTEELYDVLYEKGSCFAINSQIGTVFV